MSVITIFGLLLILLIGGLFVLLVIKGGRKGRLVLGGVGLLVFLLVVTHLGVRVFPSESVASLPPTVETVPAVWQAGIEDQFEADVYPSPTAALRAVGRRMDRPIRKVLNNGRVAEQIVLFKENNDGQFLQELIECIKRGVPEANVFVEASVRDIEANEVGIIVQKVDYETRVGPSASSWPSYQPARGGGRIEATALRASRRCTIGANFVNKPWVENFAEFASQYSKRPWIVARSTSSCTSQEWARREALTDATRQLAAMLRKNHLIRGGFSVEMSDVLDMGIIADRFFQSFDGTAGRIWRQALLIDVSQDKLRELARHKAEVLWSQRMTWGRIIFSIVGMTVLICVVYLFLNAATRGYYSLALRVAAFVLVIIGVFLILVFIS